VLLFESNHVRRGQSTLVNRTIRINTKGNYSMSVVIYRHEIIDENSVSRMKSESPVWRGQQRTSVHVSITIDLTSKIDCMVNAICEKKIQLPFAAGDPGITKAVFKGGK